MRKISILFFLLILNISVVFAAQTKVKKLRINTMAEKTQLVFDVSAIPEYNIFHLKNPNRLVVDFKNTFLEKSLTKLPKKHRILMGLRSAGRNKKDLRVVFVLQDKVSHNSFALKANKKYGPRLVINLPVKNNKTIIRQQAKKQPVVVKTVTRRVKPFIVAVDAGHGGKDSGAHGKHGTLEKKVVFEIAQKLTNLINKQPGMKAIMVRKGDYFVPLRERMNIARKANADLFVSVHADAFKDSGVTGASVFTLSRNGASKEAKQWLNLAKHENSVDLIGGINLNNKGGVLASVLLDLSQTASQDISQLVAKDILKNVGRVGELHSKKVQKAAFMVLKSPDIPSILVETAFISNPKEERRLKSAKYQYKLAKAIQKGIVSYARKHTIAQKTIVDGGTAVHKISKGETLLGIALQYGVTLDNLKRANMIAKSNKIRVGQVLSIPVGS